MLQIGVSLDLASRVLPEPRTIAWQLLQVSAGILAVGFGSAFFLTANLGPGPRDGWMTGIHRRTGFGIASVRTTLELSAVAYALLLGYALAAIFRLMTLITPNAQTVPDTA